MTEYLKFCFTNYPDFWILYIGTIIFVLLTAVAALLKDYLPKCPAKRGEADKDTLMNLTLVIPIAKTVYRVVGYFSRKSKHTAKEKVVRLLQKETQK